MTQDIEASKAPKGDDSSPSPCSTLFAPSHQWEAGEIITVNGKSVVIVKITDSMSAQIRTATLSERIRLRAALAYQWIAEKL
jgi:hypothetical protein